MVVTAFSPGVLGRIDASVRRSGAVTARNITALRSAYWLLVLSGFVEPFLYLVSIGYGVGALIGPVTLDDGQVVSYAQFVAPAMLASSAMSGALAESTFNFFAKMKFAKQFDAILATPVRPMEIAFGELAWAMARGALYSGSFVVIMAATGLTEPTNGLGAFVAALFVGFCFGSLGMAIATFMRSWQDFDLMATIQVALFLFSATFTPLSAFHSAVFRVIVQASPLYQAVVLVRGFSLGDLTVGMAGHLAYLLIMASVGLAIASRRMRAQLLP